MNYLNAPFLAVTAAVLLLALIVWRIGAWRRRRALRDLLGDFAADPQAVKLSRPRRFWRHMLLAIAIAALGVTAARPYWRRAKNPVSVTGRDVLVLFDVSKSMRSTDLAPSRLEHARYLLREIVSAFPGDRFGLIAFAGKAFLSCPLTSDSIAFEQYVDELSVASVPVGGTDLEAGFAAALRALSASGGEDKTLLVLTDGEELTGDSAHLIEKLKATKVQVIIVGLGDTSGAPVLDDAGNFRRDAEGKMILSRLNEKKLREIAAACGGVYLHSTVTDNGFAAIRRQLLVNQKKVRREAGRALPVENFTWFLSLAAAALVLYFLIPERKKLALVFCLLGVWSLQGAGSPAIQYRDAVTLQQKGDTAAAISAYEKLLADPKLPATLAARVRQNLGVVPHEAARHALDEAQKAVESQQLESAQKLLADGEKNCADAESYYAAAFALGAADFDAAPLLSDLNLLDADRREIENLKKKIEELQKQQQAARDKTKEAQKENQQSQKSQQNSSQQKQGGASKSESSALNEASEATEKLSQSAEKMKQSKLRDAAENARKKLDEAKQAQAKNDRKTADRKLTEALAALGEDNSAKKQGSSSAKGDSKEKKEGKGNSAEEQKTDRKKAESDRLLWQMLDRENERRQRLTPVRGSGRIPKVEKDW